MTMRISKPSATKDAQADPFITTVTISRLRRKLGDPPIITTTPGAGYRIASQAACRHHHSRR
jgi:DNA-binding response OmpR family regulator